MTRDDLMRTAMEHCPATGGEVARVIFRLGVDVGMSLAIGQLARDLSEFSLDVIKAARAEAPGA